MTALKELLLGTFLLGFSCLAFAQSPQDQIEAVTAALGSHEFARAVDLTIAALKTSPGSPELWAMQGAAYSGEGQPKEAAAAFDRALKIDPDYIPALQGAAQIEYDAGSPAGIPRLQRLIRLRPKDLTSHAMLAVLEYQQGNCTAAVGHFEKAEALFDTKAEGLHAYATCLVRLKQLEKAATIFQRAVELNPEDQRERQLLASLQLMAHKPEQAISTLRPLLDGTVPDADTLELASSAYEDAKDTDRAVNTLQQAILLDPNNVNLYLDFATISAAHQSFQVGINVVNEGIGLLPNAAPLYFARGVLYVQSGQYDAAQADFERAYQLDPSQSLSAAAQALAGVQANDFVGALATVQAKLSQRPNDAVLLYLQADILTEKGADPGTTEFALAMRSAKRAVSLRPTLAAARGVLAKLYLETGQYPAAIEQCRKALILNPKDQTAVYHLIQAFRKTGNKKEIPELLKRLAQLRAQAAKEERERDRYKLVEADPASKRP